MKKQLLIKEYQLGINKFLIFSPLIFALLLFIPEWTYIIAFMYVFWLFVPTIYNGYNVQNDFTFTQMLPVLKKDIVSTKIWALALIELFQVVASIIVAVINNQLYGPNKIFLDLNFVFFANVLIMYSIFNMIFFPYYFKTAFFFGKGVVFGSVFAILYAIGIELLNIFYLPLNKIFEAKENLWIQIIIFIFSIFIFFISLFAIIKKSTVRFENKK